MKPRGILLLIDSLSGGGAELVVSNLCKGIDRTQFDVGVCCLKEVGERGVELRERGFAVDLIPSRKRGVGRYLRWLPLARLVRDRRIELIHSHSTGGLVDGVLARMAARRVRHVHTFHFGNYPHGDRTMLTLERAFSRFPNRLVAVGFEQRNALAEAFGLPCGRIQTIWNGVEIPPRPGRRHPTGRKTGGDQERTVVCSISTLIEQKGVTFLLDAASMLARHSVEFELWVVGHGPLREELEAKSRRLGLTRVVKFLGWVPNAPAAVLPRIDLFVQPSLWEAMSMVVLEAMAAGKPVLVTDVGDNRHLIDHGRDGIIVPRMDAGAMARELERLIRQPGLRRRLGRNARCKVSRDGSTEAMAANYQRLYQRLLGDRI